MKDNRIKDSFEKIAGRDISENTNLWPRIAARLEKKSFALPRRPFAAVMLSLLFLLALTGAAYAIGNMLGYIPGIGIVDGGSHFRMLAEPVSQTRDGITITVSEAMLSANKALIIFKVEGIPSDKYSPLDPFNTCFDSEELHLANGESLKISGGSTNPIAGKMGYESRYTFAPVPANTSEATLFIPCIQGEVTPGTLPINWELSLRFIPAPPDISIIPVIEVTPSPASSWDVDEQNPFVLTKIIDTGDSYILIGDFDPPAPSQAGEWYSEMLNLTIVDAAGRNVNWEAPFDIDLPDSDSLHHENWAAKFTKGFIQPLHITYTTRYVFRSYSPQTYTFEFDAGTDPRPGQEWHVNQDFKLAGHTMRLKTITAGATGYFFLFQTDNARVNRVFARIDGYALVDHGGSAGIGSWSVYGFYSEIPKGKLNVILSDLYLNGETKDWTLNWQP